MNRGEHGTQFVRGSEIRVRLHLYLRPVPLKVGITCEHVPARQTSSQMLIIISSNDHGCAIENLLALHSVLLGIKEALLLASLLLGNVIAHHVIRVAPSRAADLVLLALTDTRLVSLALVF
jgi:hypothetical protein